MHLRQRIRAHQEIEGIKIVNDLKIRTGQNKMSWLPTQQNVFFVVMGQRITGIANNKTMLFAIKVLK